MGADLKLRVRNFLGIAAVDIDIAGITLVGGGNGAGKSSLLEAAGCAATMNPAARGMKTKKKAEALIADGKDGGAIKLDYRDGEATGAITITYPACAVAQTGKPLHLGSPLGIGMLSYASLSAEQRAGEITQRFETRPTKDDLVAWFKEHPDAKIGTDDIDAMIQGIEDQGWDAYHKAALEHGTKIRGGWEKITKRRWGSAIARTWMPSSLMEGETYDLKDEQAALDEARSKLETLAAREAISADYRRRLEQDAGRADDLTAAIERLTNENATLSSRAEELITERSHHIDAADAHNSLKCPHCNKRVQYLPDGGERGQLKALKGAPTWDEIQEGKTAVARIDQEKKGVVERMQANATAKATAETDLAMARRAAATLTEIANLPESDEAAIAAARKAVTDQELKVRAVQQLSEAIQTADEFFEHEHIIGAVGPAGVRSVVLRRRLSEINAKLAEISSTARFPDVQLDDDLEPTYGGRAYALISESERWRVDLALQVLLAEQENAHLLLVDRLDVLEPGARPGVLKMLKSRGIPTLMACTAREQSALPDLARAKFGSVHWLEKGRLVTADA